MTLPHAHLAPDSVPTEGARISFPAAVGGDGLPPGVARGSREVKRGRNGSEVDQETYAMMALSW